MIWVYGGVLQWLGESGVGFVWPCPSGVPGDGGSGVVLDWACVTVFCGWGPESIVLFYIWGGGQYTVWFLGFF